ncbi:MAG: N-acetylmuramoyl-L-alanine amidase [Clostridiales bacterium]|nr:N-acetylmuramoyl-L-alanine amidase [Clostridiales bacterium]
MSGLNSSEKARFEKFLASLPPDRKKALYEHFRQMDAEERNEAIRKILAKTAPKKKQEGKAGSKVHQRPSQQQRPRPQSNAKTNEEGKAKTAVKARTPAKSETPTKAEIKKDSKQVKQTKRPNFNRIVNCLTVIVVLGCFMTLALAYLTNKEEINRLFAKPDTTVATESSETSDPGEGKETSSASSGSSEESIETTVPAAPTASPSPVPIKADAPDLSNIKIVIDPMHQAETSPNTEELMPNKTAFKPAATEGGKGVKTGVAESSLMLDYALTAKEYLEGCGAEVVLTRNTNDIDLSNQDRAKIATSSNCDIYLRLEARSVEDPELTGVRVCIPEYGKSKTKDFATGKDLSKIIAGAENMEDGGVVTTMAYTGLNYATSVHAFQLNLGFLSNENDETILTDSGNIYNVAVSLAEFCDQIK